MSITRFGRRLPILLAMSFAWVSLFAFPALAQRTTINLVAFGASNTAGKGVRSGEAWPAQLAEMLRAKGYQVNLSVVGLPGVTSDVLLSRVPSAVPIGTQVVVYDVAADNDRKRFGTKASDRQAVAANIEKSIRDRQAIPIQAPYGQVQSRQDGVHFTPDGHRQVAALLLPQVIAAVGGKP